MLFLNNFDALNYNYFCPKSCWQITTICTQICCKFIQLSPCEKVTKCISARCSCCRTKKSAILYAPQCIIISSTPFPYYCSSEWSDRWWQIDSVRWQQNFGKSSNHFLMHFVCKFRNKRTLLFKHHCHRMPRYSTHLYAHFFCKW